MPIGVTLWDSEVLANNIGERKQGNSDFQIVASESIADKSSVLDVGASLKASFLSGLVDIEGSAKYLHDDKTSKNQARVTLKYEATTKFQELSMDHLGRGNVKYPYVFDEGIATHVVTGILYGAQAFFVFDREVSDDENHQDIEGHLKVMINKIPSVGIEGDGSLKLEDTEIRKVEKFSCRFYGDFLLDKTPASYKDAVEVYQSLPKLLGADGENAVPMKVWLLPLTSLDSSAAKLVRQISAVYVEEAQTLLEDLKEVEIRCNDALKVTQQFLEIVKKLKTFKELCSGYKLEFQKNLAKILPSIRGGGEEEAVLAEILEKRHSSPFNNTSLNEWIDCKVREVYTVVSFTNMMKNTKIVPSQIGLYKDILSTEHALCFVFTSLESPEPYLSALSDYLKDPSKSVDPQDVEREQWYASKEIAGQMRTKAKLFSDFAEANKENQNIKFLTVGLKDEKQKGSSIYLYKDGFSVSENFEPPSKPETVTVSDINHNSVTLKVSPPRFGAENISSYSVEYCVSGEDGWQRETASTPGEVTVSDLRLNTEYMFRSRAVTSVGVGPANEVSGSIKTLPCSPPGKPQVEANSTEISVSWEKPAELGQDVHILSYVVEYAQIDSRMMEEHLQWKQIISTSETAIISGLQSETEYTVRVRCDCGIDGRSKESTTVNIFTTPDQIQMILHEVVQDISDLILRCDNTTKTTTVQQFPQILNKIKMFKNLCLQYEQQVEKRIVFSENAFQTEIHNAKHALCFIFTSLGDKEPYLTDLSQYLQIINLPTRLEPPTNIKWEQWFEDILDVLRDKAKLFGDFAEANKANMGINFLVTGLTYNSRKGATICLFEDGMPLKDDFEPPSKPETVTVSDINHNSVTLKVSPPRFGAENIICYSVEYCVSGEDGWQQKTASTSGEVTVGGQGPRKETTTPSRAYIGMTLWNHDVLTNNLRERAKNNSDFQIVASESIADKSSVLDVGASLKASFLSGLVEVEGSAKYLNDDKSSKNQARVTLQYKATTKFQELSMDHLGKVNVKYPYVFEQGLATHVVTGILYGAQAFFVFDREVSDDESHQDIEGSLKVMIKKIPSIVIEGEGSLKLEDDEIKKVEKFSCKFHGDFLLDKTPTSFQDAVEVYQSLPTLLGTNGENAVPLKVWLLPLTSLDSTAAKLVRQISAALVNEAQSVLQDFSELEMRCNDALRVIEQQSAQIVKKLKTFKELCSGYKLEFQKNLAKILPSIRGGGEEEAVLAEILEKRHSSPFNNTSLNEWIDCKVREVYTVVSFTNMMKNTKIVPSQIGLYKDILSTEHALCFVFTSLESPEPYLSALSDYLKDPSKSVDPQDVEREQWYASKEIAEARDAEPVPGGPLSGPVELEKLGCSVDRRGEVATTEPCPALPVPVWSHSEETEMPGISRSGA
ncbi:Neoverrucotoxin subunit alpha [Channa argus]|uniref:Neoverrucotoxin subunit alpha n=1 Tax=Channa argus TaxID=215402 RepID=A0A6G1Q8A7_CHAAH|nr:Neoverrucotoxin subunit alpha [Channa argus]